MKGFRHIRHQLKSVAPFLLVLLLLFLGGIYGPLFTEWNFSVLIIVMYTVAFSFYYAYIAASDLPGQGTLLSFREHVTSLFEHRLFPFMVIYLVSILTSIMLHYSIPGWPRGAWLVYFDDKTANMVMLSLILFYIYRFRSRPFLTIPLFLAFGYLVYYANNVFYDKIYAGSALFVFRTAKTVLVLFFILWNASFKKRILACTFLLALCAGIFLNFAVLAVYTHAYNKTDNSAVKAEYGIRLAQYGKHDHLRDLTYTLFEMNDVSILQRVYTYYQHYSIPFSASDESWRKILFSGGSLRADDVALLMLKEGVTTDPESLIEYARNQSSNPSSEIAAADNLVRLTAQSINEEKWLVSLIEDMDRYPLSFSIWAVKVLGETGSCLSISHLIDYLPAYNADLAYSAYSALQSLTGLRPDQDENISFNSVESIRGFREFYRENCTKNK